MKKSKFTEAQIIVAFFRRAAFGSMRFRLATVC